MRRRLALRVIITTAEQHDREVAHAQGLTHLIARLMIQMEPRPTAITTPSFDLLSRAVDMVRHDSVHVTEAIDRANPFAGEIRARFFRLADHMRRATAEGQG